MNVAFAALAAAIIAFTFGLVIGGQAISNSILKDCKALASFQWSGQAYDCRARSNTLQAEGEA